jgi:PAS domain S-box-containing protein
VPIYPLVDLAAKLRRSPERFEVLAARLPVGVYETDAKGDFVYVNEHWCTLSGLDRDSALGRSWAGVVHPEDLARVQAEWGRSRADGRDFHLDYRYMRPDGSPVWIWSRAVEMFDADGEIIGYLGTCGSTAVSPTVDRALEEAEKRFANAFEHAPIGMALVSLEGGFLRVNKALPEIVGYDSETLLGLTFQDITHPDDLATDLALVRELLDGKRRSYQMQKRYVRADGEHAWVLLSVSLVRSDAGEPLYFVSQIEDVTERRRSEDALMEAEDRFRSAFEEAPIGMAMTTVDGHYLRVNRAMCQITGYARDALEGTDFRAIIHPDDLAGNERGYADVVSGRADHYRTERRYIHADGRVVPVDLSCTVVRDSDGEPVHLLTQAAVPGRPRLAHRAVQPPPLRGGAHPRAGRRPALREPAGGARDRPRRLQVHQRLARPLDRRRADRASRRGAARPAAQDGRPRPSRRRRVRRRAAPSRRAHRACGGR